MAKKSKFKCREHGHVSPLWIRLFPSKPTPKDMRPFCGPCTSELSDSELIDAISEFYPDAEIIHITVAVIDMRNKFSQVEVRYC